jgi:aminopeptidase N
MVKTMVGQEKFRKGLDMYFDKFYGKAATIDDLVTCLQDASGRDLTQFKQWFKQVGTPTCEMTSTYNETEKTFTLNVKHECPREPKYALNFPLQMGLIGPDGKAINLELLEGESAENDLSRGVLNITKNEQTFVFKNVPKGSVPSLFREFSAPMKYNYNYTNAELRHLMKYDDEGFNRYEAGQIIVNMELDKLVAAHKSGQKLVVDEETLQSFDAIAFELMDANPSLAREMLILPGEKAMVQKMEVYDFQAAKAARDALRLAIATRFKNRFAELYKKYSGIAAEHEAKKDAPVINKEAMVARRIKNACLSYLDSQGDEFIMMAETQFKTAKNMTDEAAALKILSDNKEKSDEYMAAFYEKWKEEELVLQRWRSLL